jgi:cytochrome P450
MRSLLLWLKPRGLDALLYCAMPAAIKDYYKFTDDLARSRIEAERGHDTGKMPTQRQDMFHFMCTARDPDTGDFALSTDDLIADAHMLIVAGSHTTSAAITGLFFYLTRYPRVYKKLAKEIRKTFDSAEAIGTRPDFMAKCEYLRAVIQEALRLCPPGPSEAERTVRKGGALIAGERFAEGVELGVPKWALCQNEELFGDVTIFRPERWVVSDHPDTLNSEEDVNRLKRLYHPFSKGPGACIGQKLAMMQMCIIVGRTLWRYDIKNAEGQRVGEGHPDLGWGRNNRMQYQFKDAYIGLHEGPIVQFKKRCTEQP